MLLSSAAWGENEIGFIEKFALAKDRAAVLAQLVPGTEDYYFFHALHFQNGRQAPKLAEIMEQWGKRFPNSERRKIIENREALLAYDANPQTTLKFLRDRLQLQFNDAQQVRDLKPDLPTALDPARIARPVFAAQALQADDLGSLDNAALETLVRDKVALRPPQRRALLGRLARPDLPGLVELIAADLKTPENWQFGEFAIHKALLPEQLEALLKLVPALAENEEFVLTRLRKLHPGADEDIDFDPVARDAWLTRAWDYAKSLSPAFNTLKATILRQRLEFDRKRGIYNKALFLEYLKLPRRMGYVNVRHLESQARTGPEVDVNRGFTEAALPLPPIAVDEPLVREFFLQLFATEESWEPYVGLVRDTWLKPVFAEAKIVNGVGDPEKWASLLTPAAFGQLKERVDVEFSPRNPPTLAPADEVTMELFVKNAPKLIVKIYEINTLSYFLTQKRQLNTDLNLDGLVANTERTIEFANDPAAKNPFRRVLRPLKFPELKGRGAWVVELIGGGKSSRALVRKGQWSLLQQSGPAGDLITVLDETKTPVKDAAVWLDGRKFAAMPAPAAGAKKAPAETTEPQAAVPAAAKAEAAGGDGRILIPFSAEPGRKPLVLADAAGTFATLAEFEHHSENYSLDVQFHVEREQLLAGRQATLAIRAALLLNDAQMPLDLLQDAKLTITSTTLDGVSTTSEVKAPKFTPEKVFIHQFKVPERLHSLSAVLSGRVDRLIKGGEKQDLSAEESWAINGIDKSEATRTGHLSKIGEGYVYELLGKNGEPVADQQIVFQFRHREFGDQTVTSALRTDERGRVTLGGLERIARVDAAESGRNRIWHLREQGRTRPETLHARGGAPIQIPWARDFEPGSYSLLEMRAGTFVADRSRHILIPPLGPYIRTPDGKSKPGLKLPFITIENLPPGDYSLRLREEEDHEITIRVTDGKPLTGWLLGANRELEVREPAPLHIANVKVGGDAIEVILANVNKFTRVHVVASRFLPEHERFHISRLAKFDRFSPRFATPERLPNLYSGGRDIGDEYRYILERRYTAKYPGSMLARPGLLLNPWEKRSTDAEAQSQSATQAAAATAGARRGSAAEPLALAEKPDKSGDPAERGSPNLDFLANAAPGLFNLVPDGEGIVRIERRLLGDRQHLQIYAEDLANAAWRSVALEEAPAKFQELRLVRNLDPAKPFTEKKDVAVLTKGQALTLGDVLTSNLETYDTLASVFSLFTTLSHGNATLVKFGWVLDWPRLKPEEKGAKYSEFACHELNFFLSRKDPEFFAATVQPYLRNKKDKTFMDDYLVGADLARYLEPWAYARLNVVERALLGQRLPAEAANAARHLRELWELLPPNLEEQDRLFETALRGRSLSAAGAFGNAKEELERLAPALLAAAVDSPASVALAKGGENRPAKLAGAAGKPATARFAGAAPAESRPATPTPSDEKKELGLRSTVNGLARAKAAKDRYQAVEFGLVTDFSTRVDDTLALKVKLNESDYFFAAGDAMQQRGLAAQQAYYRKLGPTKEWAENNYYQLPLDQQHAGLVTINAFWRDFAAWVAAGARAPFLSANLAEAHRNFSEMMLALAVLDLPFDEPKHDTKTEGGAFTFTATAPVIVFHRQIKAAAPAKEAVELLVSQNFYRHGDRHRVEGNEKLDKYVTAEFLTGVVYGANIVVTNPTSSPQKLTLLLQIPQGALPVLGSKPTDSRNLRLEPYTTQQLDYFFYFPAQTPEGKPFPHFPVHVAKAEAVVGAAKAFAFKVVNRLSEIDKASWDYLSQYGSDAEVFAFLEQNNAARLDVTRIAWRARKSVDFFRKLVGMLEKLHVWSEPIYRYSIVHNEPAALREWLRHRDDFIAHCGPWLDAKVVRIDAIERRAYEHLEYTPLVNQRIHRLGAENRITNPVLRGQYQTLLQVLAHKPQLDAMEEMSVVYYLFLQDRIEEALARFATIQVAALPTRLQHDYFRCYASLYEEKLAEARQIATPYAGHGVDRWRGLFAEVVAQLDEIEGKAAQRPGDKLANREKQQAELAAAAPTFDVKVENRTVTLTWKNLREATLNYYLMDPEFLFSANPFVSEDSSRFSFIKPTKSMRQALPDGKDALEIPLPAEFAKANVLVEVLGAGQRKAQAYHANSFKVTLAEGYGGLEVRDQAAEGKAVGKAYVKVYARLRGGQIRFFKDGYTDLRGKFDYASLNSSDTPAPPPIPLEGAGGGANLGYQMLRPQELPAVERLAILILSDSHGALVREVNPPAQ